MFLISPFGIIACTYYISTEYMQNLNIVFFLLKQIHV